MHYIDIIKQLLDDFLTYNYIDEDEFMDAYYNIVDISELRGDGGE